MACSNPSTEKGKKRERSIMMEHPKGVFLGENTTEQSGNSKYEQHTKSIVAPLGIS